MTEALTEMGEAALLAFAQDAATTIREAEADLLRVAYQWAILHDPDRLDPAEQGKPGREKARMYGGAGTPPVCEVAAAELGARIGRTTYAAAALMADALDLHHRLPQLWARVQAGQVRASYARHVAKTTRDLTPEEAAYVDAAVAEPADGRIPWTRFEALVEAKVAQAAPEAHREKEERAAKATFAKKLRTEAHGMASYLVRAPLPVIEQIAATVVSYSSAIAEDHPDLTDDERAVQAVLQLCTPSAEDADSRLDQTPVVTLFVHTYPGPDHEGINRLESHGPVTDQWIRERLGPHARFKVQPVLDLAGQAPVDAYEIPERHRQAVHLITPADTFPYSSSLSRKHQVDHTIPYDHGGESGIGNYGPMTASHHRLKTHGRWQVRQPFPGIYLWQDPHGQTYLVDHTGTRRLPTRPRARTLEIYRHAPRLELDWAA
jgi:hypothetical protein